MRLIPWILGYRMKKWQFYMENNSVRNQNVYSHMENCLPFDNNQIKVMLSHTKRTMHLFLLPVQCLARLSFMKGARSRLLFAYFIKSHQQQMKKN